MVSFTRYFARKSEHIESNSMLHCIFTLLILFPVTSISQENLPIADPNQIKTQKSNISYNDPTEYDIEYIFELYPELDKPDKRKHLKLWIPLPREMASQKNVDILSVEPEPDSRYTDPEYGNIFLFWDFGQRAEKSCYRAEILIRCDSYKIDTSIEPPEVEPYDKTSELYKKYTQSSRSINITSEVKDLTEDIISGEQNPYLQAKRIYDFVVESVHYKINASSPWLAHDSVLDHPMRDDETGEVYYEGCCMQMSALFIAMCRSAGIPARSVFGFVGPKVDKTEEDLKKPAFDFEKKVSPNGYAAAQSYGAMGPHMWAEFYLQDIGWIPVDCNVDLFGQLYGIKIIAGKGWDIHLGPEAPQTHHNGYGSQYMPIHNGRVGYPLYAVWNIANIRTAKVKIVHQFDN